jgi:hypothetical protein
MSLIDDLIKSWLERNAVTLDGGITVALVDGGVRMRGEVNSIIRDTKKGRDIATMVVPVAAQISVGEFDVPVRIPDK